MTSTAGTRPSASDRRFTRRWLTMARNTAAKSEANLFLLGRRKRWQ